MDVCVLYTFYMMMEEYLECLYEIVLSCREEKYSCIFTLFIQSW